MRGLIRLVLWFFAVGLTAVLFILFAKAIAGAVPIPGVQGAMGRV